MRHATAIIVATTAIAKPIGAQAGAEWLASVSRSGIQVVTVRARAKTKSPTVNGPTIQDWVVLRITPAARAETEGVQPTLSYGSALVRHAHISSLCPGVVSAGLGTQTAIHAARTRTANRDTASVLDFPGPQ